ncbi:unnamed protein product [Mycena citricolor]|uniref:Uncharacterized protein n=1 Tax=Mycena citricolor TaxID=2018698 RepID=A0AAD2HYI0_9AGAR|nr:unnamed protein product [Mycena citricolor]CAK5282933.1 unnamed protein product [Mycena citricolor]
MHSLLRSNDLTYDLYHRLCLLGTANDIAPVSLHSLRLCLLGTANDIAPVSLHSLRLCLLGDRYWSYLHCAVLSATQQTFSPRSCQKHSFDVGERIVDLGPRLSGRTEVSAGIFL